MGSLKLRYGCNPHQSEASLSTKGDLPVTVLNGSPGYINFLDALNSWPLVKELKEASGRTAAASFKHVSPAGAALAAPLSEEMRRVCQVGNLELSPAAQAYALARGGDRMSSFGDWAAFSDEVDESAALIIKREVSDGVIAPSYTPEALKILKAKKGGKYNVVQIDPNYEPPVQEVRSVYGIDFEQTRNSRIMTKADLEKVVTANKELPDSVRDDLVLAMITLKYTQSNSVVYAKDGQVIGVGAGQQSRIHCTRLAGDKADIWYLRQHPKALNLPFRQGLSRPEKDNAIDLYLRDDITPTEKKFWLEAFDTEPEALTTEEKARWIATNTGVSLGSDAFFPFRDNIDRAAKSGVKYIVQPGGSVRDEGVIEACDEYGIAMACTGIRLFHH
ncbi:MAG: phosphoribosylaminoimidazolecarboxamide formyltransferase [Spirochaetales bacterium]|nr:phosphoribosylaminoimidazolecarboxamide formyltransferase [Spirochaetales bacterium]